MEAFKTRQGSSSHPAFCWVTYLLTPPLQGSLAFDKVRILALSIQVEIPSTYAWLDRVFAMAGVAPTSAEDTKKNSMCSDVIHIVPRIP